jgi:hypothetical protein
MELERRIARIERVSVRIFALVMLFIALIGLAVYAAIELCKFVSHVWLSW